MKSESAARLRVLLLEDNPADADLVLHQLKRAGIDAETICVITREEFEARLDPCPDAILSDYQLPLWNGLQALQLVRERGLDVPFIIISGAIDDELAVEAMRNGADDYLLKDRLRRLGAALAQALERKRLRDEAGKAAEALRERDAGLRQAQQIAKLAHAVSRPDGSFESWSETLPALIAMNTARVPMSTREWLKLLHPEDRAMFRDKSIEAGRNRNRVDMEYRLQRGDGAWIDIRHVIEPLEGEPDAAGRTRWFNTVQDITEPRRAEQIRALEHAVARHLADAQSAAAGLLAVMRLVCESEGWEFCRYWRVDETAGVLRFGGSWSVPGAESIEITEATRKVVLAPGAGLAGRVWQSGQPLWVHDVRNDARLARLDIARAAGTCGAFVFPVASEGETLGVLAFSSREFREPDERLLAAVRVIGGQIGQFLHHKESEDALRESERRFSDLLGSVQLASIMFDREAQITYCNDYFLGLTGWRRGEVLGKDLFEFLIPPENTDLKGMFADLLANQPPTWRHENEILTKSGGRRLIAWNNTLLRSEAGEVIGAASIGEDITERKQAEDRIRRLTRIYAVLSGINSTIVRVNDRDELLREACRIAVEHGGFGIAQVLLVDEDRYELWPGPSAGIDTLPVVRASFRPGAETISRQGTTIRAIRERKPAFTNDITVEPPIGALRTEALRRGYGSVISLPLTVRERIVAVLLLCAKEKDFFDGEELRLLGELAGDVSFALEHLEKSARLQIESAERLRAETKVRHLNRVYAVLSGINALILRVRDRDDLFKEACHVAVENGGFPMAWIGIVDRKEMRVNPVAWHGAGEDIVKLMPRPLDDPGAAGRGLAGQAVAERKAIISDDVTQDPRVFLQKEVLDLGYRSVVVLPLVVDVEVTAVLALYAAEAGFFDEDEMKLLNELAGDIAFALDHIEKAKRLDYLAYYDALTGFANRALFLERVNQHVHVAGPGEGKVAVVLADLDRLRTVNESLGRHAGDAVIKEFSARLAHAVDPAALGRVSADDIAIILQAVKGKSEVMRRFDAIWRDCLGQPFMVEGRELWITAKAGIALYPNDAPNPDTLLRNAEAALRKGKELGERCTFYSPELTKHTAERLTLENQLRRALDHEEFVLHYQPKVDLETRRIAGVEALIRWQSPELGLVPPLKFIPLMEQTGLILQAGAWALNRASLDHRRWVEQKLAAPRIAVNVSPIQLRQRDFVRAVEHAIMEGVAPTGIDLEITESLVMEDIESNIEKLKSVRGLGMRIAIDDFGTGYSSLGYLAKLPVHSLKIDRSFIITMLDDPDTMTLVQTMISLAHSLRLKVVAEGVDAEEQAKYLRLLRCDEMQGYLFSKPLPFDEMTALLRNGA